MSHDAGPPRGTGIAFGLVDDEGPTSGWTEPQTFRRGMFAGKTMRFRLELAQEPLHGRRKTEKDRRPLAHVPIVRLRIRECWQSRRHDGWEEEELDVSNIEGTLLICAADISSAQGSPDTTPRPLSAHGDRPEREATTSAPPVDGHVPHHRIWVPTPDTSMRVSHLREMGAPSGPAARPAGVNAREQLSRADLAVAGPGPSSLANRASWTGDSDFSRGMYMVHEAGKEEWDIMQETRSRAAWTVRREREHDASDASSDEGGRGDRRAGKKSRTQSSRNLYGSLHVAGVKVPAPEGGMGLWFLFTDLCVRYEGTYRLRLRCYDLTAVEEFAIAGEQHLAQVYSGPFKVYSPRNFPGLPKQTELSEHFSRQGFKLNTRKNERQIKTPPPTSSSSAGGRPSNGKPFVPAQPAPPAAASAGPAQAYGRDRDHDRDARAPESGRERTHEREPGGGESRLSAALPPLHANHLNPLFRQHSLPALQTRRSSYDLLPTPNEQHYAPSHSHPHPHPPQPPYPYNSHGHGGHSGSTSTSSRSPYGLPSPHSSDRLTAERLNSLPGSSGASNSASIADGEPPLSRSTSQLSSVRRFEQMSMGPPYPSPGGAGGPANPGGAPQYGLGQPLYPPGHGMPGQPGRPGSSPGAPPYPPYPPPPGHR